MAITYPLIMPTAVINMASMVLRRQEPQNISISPWTGVQQVQASQGQWWEADIELPPMKRDQADAWEVFVLQLAGSKGTFLLGDPEHTQPRGVGGGSPVVAGASQYGETLDVRNCPANVVGWLLAGDFIQLGSGATARIYRVLQDVTTNADGTGNLTIWPNLRRPSIDGEPVTLNDTVGQFRLIAGGQDFARVPLFTSISLRAIEALDGNG